MSKIALSANNNGTGIFTIASPSSNTNQTITLSDLSGSAVINEGNSIFKINSAGNVGIGTASPTNLLHIYNATSATALVSSDSSALLVLSRASTDFGAAGLNFRKYRGTLASPTTVGTGDTVGFSNYIAWDGSALRTISQIQSVVETFTAADDISGVLQFSTRPAGAAGVLTERLRISADGNVGIGTTDPGTTKLRISNVNSTNYSLIVQSPTVGLTAGNFTNIAYFTDGRALNNDGLRVVNLRDTTTGSVGNWGTSSFRIRRSVDQNDGSTGVQEEIVFGDTILAFNTGGSERMRVDSGGLITQVNATSGRGAIVGEQTFRLAANGSALGLAIADFFGATSSISLESSSVYEIIAYCVFTKTTAGTITWTMTASSAPTRMVGTYLGSPVTGIAAGTPISGFTGSQGATTAAFAATASLTTAVNHAFQITMQVQTNAATNWRLQITNSAGTATPLAGSYYTVKKISASTGTFV